MEDGFEYGELSEFKQDLIKQVRTLFPKETDKFLRQEAAKISKVQKKLAKSQVGTTGKNGNKSYHKKFKVGKIYNYLGDKSIRAYNGSPVGHLIEYGHKNIPRKGKNKPQKAGSSGFTPGKYILKQSENIFKDDFYKDCDNFLGEYFDNIGN